MNDCDKILREIAAQAENIGIPISRRIDPHVRINARAVTRFGCCKYERDGQILEVALRVAEGPEDACRETLAHELLHTCPGCRNHGRKWREYAEWMNKTYGYHIARTSTRESMGVEEPVCRYLLRCESCGREFKRFRTSRLVEAPERYRCRCGGKIKRVM